MITKRLDAPFVRTDAGALQAALVCAPSAAIDQLPPLASESSPIGERAREAHAILVRTLRDRGVVVTELSPLSGSPTESLVGDCAVVLPKGAVLMRPSAVERRHEPESIERALVTLGVPIIGRIEAPGLLDGGDVVLAGERAYVSVLRAGVGLRARSNAHGRAQFAALARAAGIDVIELSTASATTRLRAVFNVLADDVIVAATELVDTSSFANATILPVVRGEEYAAGILALGARRALMNLRFRDSVRMIRAAKIEVEAIDLWEFGKAGIPPNALVLGLKRG